MAGRRSAYRSAATIPADRKRRRRLEWEDTRRPAWVMWLSVVCLLALVATVIALSNSERMSRPTTVNGDMVGPETDETPDAYLARAAQTLDGATGPEPRWALVTPTGPADVPDLTAMFTDQPDLRVSTLLAGNVQWPLPEPAVGRRREDVFAAASERFGASAGIPDPRSTPVITGVIVRGTPDHLRAVASSPGVRGVEVLPADAVYGRFGMRPLEDVPAAADVASSDQPDPGSNPLSEEEPAP